MGKINIENINFTNEEWEEIDNKYRKMHGEQTYQELLDKIDKLENIVEDQRNTIEQYEEHQDTLTAKYFNSDGIL